MKGTVKWYDRVKGYGFLQTEEVISEVVITNAEAVVETEEITTGR